MPDIVKTKEKIKWFFGKLVFSKKWIFNLDLDIIVIVDRFPNYITAMNEWMNGWMNEWDY